MKVLVAVDELACIHPVTEFIRQHRWTEEVHISIVHVIAPIMFDYPMGAYPLLLESVQHESELVSKQILDEARTRLSGVRAQVETESVVGLPVPVIVDKAKAWHADLIVVGCHGRHGLNKLIFGSVSQEIATQSPCSVVILRIPPCPEKVAEKAKTRSCTASA